MIQLHFPPSPDKDLDVNHPLADSRALSCIFLLHPTPKINANHLHASLCPTKVCLMMMHHRFPLRSAKRLSVDEMGRDQGI